LSLLESRPVCVTSALELDLYVSEETIQASRDAVCPFKTERKNTHLLSGPEFLVLRITFIFDLFMRRLVYSRGLFPVRRWREQVTSQFPKASQVRTITECGILLIPAPVLFPIDFVFSPHDQ